MKIRELPFYKTRLVRDWNEFWFSPHPLTGVGLFRIAIGLTVLMKLVLLLPVLDDFLTDRGMFTLEMSQRVTYPPRICVFDYLGQDAVPYVFAFLIAATVLFTFGLMTRTMTIALFIGMLSIDNRNAWITNSGDRLLSILLCYGIFAPLGSALSIDRLIRIYRGKATNAPAWGSYWAVRLMQLQVCNMYFWSTFIKIRGQSWPSGEAIYWMSRNIERSRIPTPILPNSMVGINFLVYFTLFVEGFFPFAVWSRRTRGYIIFAAIMLHLGIEQSMTIQVFSFVVFAAFLLFYDGDEYVEAWGRVRSWLFRVPPTRVFYDGDCGFCSRTIVIAEAMDVMKRLDFSSFRDPAVQAAHPDLDLERCELEIMLKDGRGRWLGGFYAVRWMAWRLPATWLLAPFLYLPGIPALGDRAYKHVASHRFNIRVPGAAACRLPGASDADESSVESSTKE